MSSLPQALLQKEKLGYERGRRERPEENNFRGASYFWCRRPDVDEPNRDVFISYEEAITYVHPRPSKTVRGLYKVQKRRTLVQDRGKFVYHLSYILVLIYIKVM